ncbi:MAG: glycoside hydrolase family 99-like domain-containing protein [Betaproteobacteria bacterium]
MPDIDTRLIAFYLPQFHPIPENDAWWGTGFTEWRNVVRARPLFAGHYQPHLPADLGYCDLRVAETRIAQAALARRYGIHGFCYYYYWFNGRRLLARPLDEVHASGEPDFPFCVCWANEPWTRRWDGHDDDILVAQEYSPDADRRLFADLAPLFRDARYIRVEGRPLFVVYRANSLPDPRAFALRFREEARRARIEDPFLACVQLPGMPPPTDWGFDAGVEFPPHGFDVGEVSPPVTFYEPGLSVAVWDYVQTAKSAIARAVPAFPLFRGVMTGWDNTPRLPKNGHVFVNVHPANYQRWLTAVVAQTAVRHPPEQRLVFINAWNEWAEGCHLEPDEAFGHAYLEATQRALADGERR